jgi:hypothetical protein
MAKEVRRSVLLGEGRIAGVCVGTAPRFLDEGKINCVRRRRGRSMYFLPSLCDRRYATKILFCSPNNLAMEVDCFLFVIDPAVRHGFCGNFVDPVSSPFNRFDHSAYQMQLRFDLTLSPIPWNFGGVG